jgi:prevent-host-death family protein
MTVYTYSEARQNFASILEQARKDGEVLVRRKDGTVFVIKPVAEKESPLDVPGTDTDLTRDEIVDFVREVRSR